MRRFIVIGLCTFFSAPLSTALADAPASTLRVSGGFGSAMVWPTWGEDNRVLIGAAEERGPEPSGFAALGLTLGVDYAHASRHGGFARLSGFTEVSFDLEIFAGDVERTYNYGGFGFAFGYRFQFVQPSLDRVQIVPALMVGPAIEWFGFDSEAGQTCSFFSSTTCTEDLPFPEHEHTGVGGLLGGDFDVQIHHVFVGLESTFQYLWLVDQSANGSQITRDGVLLILAHAGYTASL